jgi:hypothetical protein
MSRAVVFVPKHLPKPTISFSAPGRRSRSEIAGRQGVAAAPSAHGKHLKGTATMGVKDWNRMSRDKAEKQWLDDMKSLGREVVLQRFTNRLPVTDRMPYPDSGFVQRWLDRQHHKARIWAAVLTASSIVAAIAACIAAWPVVRDWIH